MAPIVDLFVLYAHWFSDVIRFSIGVSLFATIVAHNLYIVFRSVMGRKFLSSFLLPLLRSSVSIPVFHPFGKLVLVRYLKRSLM